MIDDLASARAGIELESTAFVRDLQRPIYDAAELSDDAVNGLYQVLAGNAALVSWRVMRELKVAGFLDRRERPTDKTLALAPHWVHPLLELYARGARVGGVSVWGAGVWAVVSASADELGKRHLGGAPLNRVPAQLAAWLGVAPQWTFFDDAPATISRSHYEACLAGPGAAAPPEVGPELSRAWGHQWTEYEVVTRVYNARLVDTGEVWLVVRSFDDTSVSIEPLPSMELFTALIAMFSASVTALS